MGVFKKSAASSGSSGGNWIKDGDYTFMVEKLIVHTGEKDVSFVAELRVLESSPGAEVYLDAKNNPIAPNRPGSTCSYVQNMTKFDSAHNNIKAFFIGLMGGLGWQPEQIGEPQMDAGVDESNPFRGAIVKCSTFRKKAKSSGTIMTLPKWTPVEQTIEDIAKGKLFLASNAAKADPTAPKAETFSPVAGTSAVAALAQAQPTPATAPPVAATASATNALAMLMQAPK